MAALGEKQMAIVYTHLPASIRCDTPYKRVGLPRIDSPTRM
jgi:hypothetical protein